MPTTGIGGRCAVVPTGTIIASVAATSRLALGALVPMPILLLTESMYSLKTLFVLKINGLSSALPINEVSGRFLFPPVVQNDFEASGWLRLTMLCQFGLAGVPILTWNCSKSVLKIRSAVAG